MIDDSLRNDIAAPAYTYENFAPGAFRKMVKKTVRKVRAIMKKHPEIQALAACGHSGLMLMGAVSYELGLPQIAVRKSRDTQHDSRLVNGWLGCKGYLIIDDLIESGRTIEHIIKEISKAAEGFYSSAQGAFCNPKPVAILLYQEDTINVTWKLFDGKDNIELPTYDIYVRGLKVRTSNPYTSTRALEFMEDGF